MARWVKSHNQIRMFKQSATPAVIDGLAIGDVWIDTSGTAAVKVCTAISPVTFAAVGGGGSVAESSVTFTDITTNNVSTTKHGYTPKLSNDATQYLDGTGAYTIPAGATTHNYANGTALASRFISGTITYGDPTIVDISAASSTTGAFSATDDTVINLNASGLINIDGAFNPTFTALTTLNLSSLVSVGGAWTGTMDGLTSINLSSLTSCSDAFTPTWPNLTTLALPALNSTGANFDPTINSVTSLSLPSLVVVPNQFKPTGGALTSLTCPALVEVGVLWPIVDLVTTLDFPALVNVTTGYIQAFSASLTTMTFPVIETIFSGIRQSEFGSSNTPNLTTFTLGASLKAVGGNVALAGSKLNQASVDNVLVRLAALDGTNGTTTYSSKTVDLDGGTNATPSATGLAAKAVLVGRSCTVNTN